MALTVRLLKDLTAPLAGDLAARGVSAVRLAAIHPGGEENSGRDGHAWLRYYGRLCAERALAERDAGTATPEAQAADAVILAALAGAPVPVARTGNETERFAAYPKSAFALLTCHSRSLLIARLVAYASRLGQSDDPDASELAARALAEALHQHRMVAWIACTEGPGLPFRETDEDPELPAEYRDLAPHTIIAICRAFDEANWARLRALEPLITPDPDDEGATRTRPSWSQFFGSVIAEQGVASERLMRDRALAGLVATSQLAASAQREAMAAAKERAAERGED